MGKSTRARSFVPGLDSVPLRFPDFCTAPSRGTDIAASTRAFSPSARAGYANLLDEAKPQQVDNVRLRYRALIEACDNGKDIPLELAKHLNSSS
jgi:hypothetical protein